MSCDESAIQSPLSYKAEDTYQKPVRFAKDFSAGWIGGIAQVLVGQPFDTIKVLLQTQSSKGGLSYRNPIHCVLETTKKDGIAGLYRGTTVPLFGIGLCVSIQFSVLEQMKIMFTLINGNGNSLTLNQLAICGSVAGIANTVVSGPVEHIRIRLQARKEHFNGAFDCIKKIYQANGIRGIYQGNLMTILRDGIGFGAYFLAYESLISHAQASQSISRSQIETWRLVLYGAIAGASFWSVVFPLDVIKTKIQIDSYTPASKQFKLPGASLACARHIWTTDGISGFFKGFTPCFLRSAPVNAATFVAFEYAMRILN